MKKLLLILALVLCLLLSGCGAKDPYEGIENPSATITLTDGRVMYFELLLRDAPNTVANFVSLANQGYYDGLEIFRVVPGVLAQTGDKNNDGTGNAGYTIQGEFAANGIENEVKHIRGTISMCRTSSYDSASSQFFIVGGSYPEYDGEYAAFGRALDSESLEVIDDITTVQVDSNYSPIGNMPRIDSVRVSTHGYKYTPATIALPEETEGEADKK
ncbi:MAG: peptidylprolyl isomerase [Clostridia bacterium]|nr:peptidylprolyl isomerase [Clostridia bacterium]